MIIKVLYYYKLLIMKKLLLLLLVIFAVGKAETMAQNADVAYVAMDNEVCIDEMESVLASALADGIDKQNCTFTKKGKTYKLYGKVQIVNSFPDIKVQIVDSFPDVDVKIVNSFPDNCGKVQIVNSFPDVKVQIVDSFPDIKVRIVNSFPGVK